MRVKSAIAVSALTAASAISNSSIAGESQQVTLQASDVAAFLARPTTVTLPSLFIDLANPEVFLVRGTRDSVGNCNWSYTIDPPAGLSKDVMYSTIETAYDPTTCEVVEKRGFRSVPVSVDSVSPSQSPLTLQLPVIGSSGATDAAAGPTRVPEGLPCSGSSRPTSPTPNNRIVGAYVEWTDGNQPLMQMMNAEITANWVRGELNFKNNFCNIQNASLVSYVWYDYCGVSGWEPDPPTNNPSAYAAYSCTGPAGQRTGSAYLEVYATFTNATFPGCGPVGVTTHYNPVKVIANNDGTLSWPVTSTRSGQLAGCGEYLVQHRDLYDR